MNEPTLSNHKRDHTHAMPAIRLARQGKFDTFKKV
jgi:hypothetical protein